MGKIHLLHFNLIVRPQYNPGLVQNWERIGILGSYLLLVAVNLDLGKGGPCHKDRHAILDRLVEPGRD